MHKPHDLVITQAWLPRYQRRIFTLSLCALTKSSRHGDSSGCPGANRAIPKSFRKPTGGCGSGSSGPTMDSCHADR